MIKKISLVIIFAFTGFGIYAQTTISGSFLHGGLMRSYRVYIPAIYNAANPVPLVFNLHGYTSNNIQQELYGDFRPIADTANFIIVHPNGTQDGSGNLFWNTFGGSAVDDVGFLSALIDTIKADYNIDDHCIYSTGMSNGGFMSYDLACFLSNRIAAVASVTGSMIWTRLNACNPSHPVPVMHIHGTGDATVPYNGSGAFVAVDSLVRYWATQNNCSLIPLINTVPDINPNDGCTAEHFVFDNGASGSKVELYKINGGGHSWPGAPVNLNVTNMDFSASIEIWKFFRQYKLDALTELNEMDESNPPQFLPNPCQGSGTLTFNNYSVRAIYVYDSIGRLVENRVTDHLQWPIVFPAKGFYFVLVSEAHRSFTIKVMNQ